MPEVTVEEKRRLLLLILLSGLVVLIGNKFLFPWIRHIADVAHCYTYFGVNGFAVFFAGVVLFTVGSMFGVYIYIFCLSVRTVRHKQFPPPGRYFIRPKRFQYGRPALVRGYAAMAVSGIAAPAFLLYAAHGVVPIIEKAANLEPSTEECAAEKAANSVVSAPENLKRGVNSKPIRRS